MKCGVGYCVLDNYFSDQQSYYCIHLFIHGTFLTNKAILVCIYLFMENLWLKIM